MGAILVLVVTFLATPFQSPATFSGSLIDGTGRALPAVSLTLVNSATGEKIEIRSESGGRFSAPGLAAGEYRIEISKPEFAPVVGRVVLASGQRLRRDVVAQVAGIRHSYTVDVKANPARAQRTVVRGAPPADPCTGITAAGCVTPPTRMVEAWPAYPRIRAEKGVTGSVEITGRLGTDGFLKDLRADVDSDPEFAAAAIAALRLWEYAPVRLNGVPQEVPFAVTFRFTATTD